MLYPQPEQRQVCTAQSNADVPEVAAKSGKAYMQSQSTRYDILRREDNAAIWLETSADLNAAKSRIKKIVSFWPGRFEVVDHQSQQIVAAIAKPSRLGAPFRRVRESAGKSLGAGYSWLLAPAPSVADFVPYKRLRRYAQNCYRTSWGWLCSPATRVQAYRSR
jgi:hypothetical protein